MSSLILSDRSLQLPGLFSNSLTDVCSWHLNDVTQIEEDTKSIIAEIEIVFLMMTLKILLMTMPVWWVGGWSKLHCSACDESDAQR